MLKRRDTKWVFRDFSFSQIQSLQYNIFFLTWFWDIFFHLLIKRPPSLHAPPPHVRCFFPRTPPVYPEFELEIYGEEIVRKNYIMYELKIFFDLYMYVHNNNSSSTYMLRSFSILAFFSLLVNFSCINSSIGGRQEKSKGYLCRIVCSTIYKHPYSNVPLLVPNK